MSNSHLDFQSIVDKLPLLAGVIASDGKGVYFNQKVLRYTLLSAQDLATQWQSFITIIDGINTADWWKQQLSRHSDWQINLQLSNANGKEGWFKFKFTPLQFSEDRVTQWLFVASDIQEQIDLEGDMAIKAAEFKELFDSLPTLVQIVNLDTTTYLANQTLVDFVGLPVEEITFDVWQDVLHEEDFPLAAEKWGNSLQTGEPFEVETRMRNQAGNYEWYLTQSTPLYNEKGEITRWYAAMSNIHAHKMSELQKESFIDIASHELRTPLTVLQAYLQILEKNIVTPPNSKYIKQSLLMSHKLDQLIASFLELSRLENPGKDRTTVHGFHIDRLLANVVADFQHISKREFLLELNTPHLQVNANVQKIEQVVSNLLTNALKYSSDPIYLSTQQTTERLVCVTIRDQGRGIAADDLDRIFERFYQTGKHLFTTGFGLGLYISKRIIEMYGGQIWAESQVGQGASFHFTLPIYDPEAVH